MGIFALSRWLTRRAVRILCYHGTWRTDDDFTGDAMFIRPVTFAQRLDTLSRLGFVVVPLDAAMAALSNGRQPTQPTVVITIDDGWFGTYADMLPALEAREVPATLYCDTAHLEYGGPIPHVFATYLRRIAVKSEAAASAFVRATDLGTPLAARLAALFEYAQQTGVDLSPYLDRRSFSYMSPAELRDASARGLDVQLHTHNHSLYDFKREQVANEIELNRRAIERLVGVKPLGHFCYPSGVTHRDAAEHLSSCGVVSATTTQGGLAGTHTDRFALPRYLDGDNVSPIEFEARMSGFIHLVHSVLLMVKRGLSYLRPGSPKPPPAGLAF